MFDEEVYFQPRLVTCEYCHLDNEQEIPFAVIGTVEVGEWLCSNCDSYNEYRNDTAHDLDDYYHDMRNEGY